MALCDILRIHFFLLFGEFIEWDPIKVTTTDLFMRFFACCHLAYFGILCNPVGDWLGQWFISGLLQASFLSYQLECDEWQLVLNPAVLLKWNDDGRIKFKLHKNGSSLQWVGFLWYVAKKSLLLLGTALRTGAVLILFLIKKIKYNPIFLLIPVYNILYFVYLNGPITAVPTVLLIFSDIRKALLVTLKNTTHIQRFGAILRCKKLAY